MIDLARISMTHLAVLERIQDDDPTRDVRQTSLATHESGYWAAQAAGHALLRSIDALAGDLASIPLYVTDELEGDLHENPRFFEIEMETRLTAVSPAATHALSIAIAQDRPYDTIRLLQDGVAIASQWERMTPQQRVEIYAHQRIEDFPDHGADAFEDFDYEDPKNRFGDFRFADLSGFRSDERIDGYPF